ncbi:CaiB/BaiF CoA transferase family protein [Streptomyces melanosporofaciens]|uniref:Alpha-methylacyl-CoA racemase n=1 Tax=Streptomyces melanosporofaciens TaxID=67327 RepID=A0A1H4KKT1_STRMJ|nr:CaiB/BaiF CoA-transferase family protein [Streptomyces melanosporofaciens]SEB58846.1 alpha-methylacyl-CoA racemase [Streptomyces melanosporofaciens]
MTPGPLNGLRVLELAAIGPVPHAAMILADLGADVLRVERSDTAGHPGIGDELLLRGRRTLRTDLKSIDGRELALRLATRADVLLEGMRPGVAERLGIGPGHCHARNPALVYGRATGWGQDGPLAERAGHDINYIALTGALHAIGPADGGPVPPLNLLGDFGGGSLFLVVGVLAALWERDRCGEGQTVDAALVDGTSVLMQMIWSLRAAGRWQDSRGANRLDGGAPFYGTYACADGRWIAVGALEPQFYAQLLEGLGLADASLPKQSDPTGWPALRARFAEAFASRPRSEWLTVFADTDACVSPVLSLAEVTDDPHIAARSTVVDRDGIQQAAPAPRFSRAARSAAPPAPPVAVDPDTALASWQA